MFVDLPELEERLGSDDAAVRQETCYLLGKVEEVDAANLLVKALSDADPMVQQLAEKGLRRLEMLGIVPDVVPDAGTGGGGSAAPPSEPAAPVAAATQSPVPVVVPEATAPVTPAVPSTMPAPATTRSGAAPVRTSPQSTAAPTVPATLPKQTAPRSESRSATPVQPGKPAPKGDGKAGRPTIASFAARLSQPMPVVVAPSAPDTPPVEESATEGDAVGRPVDGVGAGEAPVAAAPTAPVAEPVVELPELPDDEPPALPPRKPGAPEAPSPKAPAPGASAPKAQPPAQPVDPADVNTIDADVEPAAAAAVAVDDSWEALLAAADKGAFPAWFAGLGRQEKIGVLTEMEKRPSKFAWAQILKMVLADDDDTFVVSKLIKVFGKHHGPGAVSTISPYLQNEDSRVVSNGLEALSLAGGPRDLELIATFLDHQDARIKTTAANCMWGANPQLAMRVIQKLVKSPKIWERDAAKFALQSCPLDEGKALLTELEEAEKSGKRGKSGAKAAKPATPVEGDQAVVKELTSEPQPLPEWAEKLGPLGPILMFPVHVGAEEPVPLFVFIGGLLFLIGFAFLVVIPVLNMIFPEG